MQKQELGSGLGQIVILYKRAKKNYGWWLSAAQKD